MQYPNSLNTLSPPSSSHHRGSTCRSMKCTGVSVPASHMTGGPPASAPNKSAADASPPRMMVANDACGKYDCSCNRCTSSTDCRANANTPAQTAVKRCGSKRELKNKNQVADYIHKLGACSQAMTMTVHPSTAVTAPCVYREGCARKLFSAVSLANTMYRPLYRTMPSEGSPGSNSPPVDTSV